MSKPDDGGPVHPTKGMTGITGITKRELFAAMFVQSFIGVYYPRALSGESKPSVLDSDFINALAVGHADALLSALNKEKKNEK